MVAFSKIACFAATASAQRELFLAPAPVNTGFLSQTRTSVEQASAGYVPYAAGAQPLTYNTPVYASPDGFEYASYETPSQGWGLTALLSALGVGALAGRALGQYFSTESDEVESPANLQLAALALAGREVPSRTGAPMMFGGSSSAKPKAAAKKPAAKVAARKPVPKKAPVRKPAPVIDSSFCYGLPGNIAPAGNWDPLNLLEGLDKGEVLRRREAELTHGRVAMLASLGFLVQESFHPLFGGRIDGAAINSIPQIPTPLWFIMTLGIGIAETARIQKGWANPYEGMGNVQALKAGYTPGDLDWDPLGIKPEDPAEFRTMQERELSHGRLAMLAAAGFLAQETVDQQPWLASWQQ